MFAEKGPRPWWERFEITIHFEGGQLRIRCGVEAPGNCPGFAANRKYFRVLGAPAELLQLAENNADAEIHFDGVKYRANKYRVDHGGVNFYGDPIGTVGVPVSSSARPSIQEQCLETLRATPGGMTARQLEDKLQCSRRAIFSALAALVQSNQVAKDGLLYRARE
jgi:hypothetical protein